MIKFFTFSLFLIFSQIINITLVRADSFETHDNIIPYSLGWANNLPPGQQQMTCQEAANFALRGNGYYNNSLSGPATTYTSIFDINGNQFQEIQGRWLTQVRELGYGRLSSFQRESSNPNQPPIVRMRLERLPGVQSLASNSGHMEISTELSGERNWILTVRRKNSPSNIGDSVDRYVFEYNHASGNQNCSLVRKETSETNVGGGPQAQSIATLERTYDQSLCQNILRENTRLNQLAFASYNERPYGNPRNRAERQANRRYNEASAAYGAEQSRVLQLRPDLYKGRSDTLNFIDSNCRRLSTIMSSGSSSASVTRPSTASPSSNTPSGAR